VANLVHRLVGFLSFVVVGALAPVAAQAQADYPSRTVRLVVPFGAGGIADVHSRVTAAELSKRLGQQVIVENQPAGLGIPAARSVLQAPPDGHTLALFANGTATAVSLIKDLTFDPVKDFVPVANLVYFDFIIAVNAGSSYRSVADIVTAAKENPGKLNIGTTAKGSSSNLAAELFRLTTGIQLTVVPYRTASDLPVALLRNDVDVVLDSYTLLKSSIDAGSVRVIASTGAKRSAILPEVPTVQESGVAGFDVTSWNAVFARAGTPPAIIQKLNGEIRAIQSDPAIRQRLIGIGVEGYSGPSEELGERLKSDIAKWAKVIEQAGIEKR
jgi:tripartite-type tricarboxylate transporter receptor subunit TctC